MANSLQELKRQLQEVKAEAISLGDGAVGYDKLIAKAGQLKDKLDDTNEAIKEMASGSKFEQFGNTLGSVGSKLKNLDFEGVAESAGKLQKLSKQMTFSEAIGGIKSLSSGFISMGKALLMNPLFLIVGAVIAIGVALYELKDKVKIIGDAFDFLGDIIHTVVQGVKDFLDWIGLTSFAVEENAKKTIDATKKIGEANDLRYSNEIKLAKAAGKDTYDLEQKKIQVAILSAGVQLKAYQTLREAHGKLTEDEIKEQDALIKTINQLSVDSQVLRLEHDKEASDKSIELYKKSEEDRKKIAESSWKEQMKMADDAFNAALAKYKKDTKDFIDENEKKNKDRAEFFKKSLDLALENQILEAKFTEDKKDDEEARYAKEINDLNNSTDEKIKKTDEYQKHLELLRKEHNANLDKIDDEQAEKDTKKRDERNASIIAGINSLASSISTVLSAIGDYNQAKADEAIKVNEEALNQQLDTLNASRDQELAKEGLTATQKDAINKKYALQKYALELQEYNQNTAIKKKAFEQDKKMKIAMAVISTITGAIAAVTGMISSIPGPVGIILGVIAGAAVTAAGVLQIAKIRNTQFEAGAAPSPPSISIPTGGGEASSAATTPNFGLFAAQGQGQGNNQGNQGPSNQPPIVVKAVVIGNEITDSQSQAAYSNSMGTL